MTGATLVHRVQARWPDLDGLGHVHHGAIVAHLEVGRDALLTSCGIGAEEYVVRHLEIDYLQPVLPRDGEVACRTTVARVGTTSLRTEEALLGVDGELLVTATFDLVLWDPATSTKRSVTDAERSALEGAPTHRKDAR